MLKSPLLTGRSLLRRSLAVAICLGVDLALFLSSFGFGGVDWIGGTAPTWTVAALLILGHAVLGTVRSPWAGYTVFLALIVVRPLIPSLDPFAGYALALFLMARAPVPRHAWLALAGAAVAVVFNTIGVYRIDSAPGPSGSIAVSVFIFTLVYVTVWTVGRMLGRSDRRLIRHQATALAAREAALAKERLRISRELHDSVAHSLTAIVLQSAGARTALRRRAASEEEMAQLLSGIESTASQSMRELHRMLGMLRTPDPEDILNPADACLRRGPDQAPLHGLDEIAGLVETVRESGVDVVSTVSGVPVPVDPSVGHTAYRVVQEGLSNVMKHAGPGARAQVTLEWRPARLVLSVRNTQGTSSPAASVSGGFGLAGLRERLDVAGGTLQAGPTSDGYLLQVSVPTTVGTDTPLPTPEEH